MIGELFLIAALSPRPAFVPAGSIPTHTPPLTKVVGLLMKSEEERLRDFIHRGEPGADIFIHPSPHSDRLKEHGWERVPFTWRGNEIWIQRKPKSDHHRNAKRAIEMSA